MFFQGLEVSRFLEDQTEINSSIFQVLGDALTGPLKNGPEDVH